MAEHYWAGTARTYLSALRSVLRECWRLGLLDTDEYEHARDPFDDQECALFAIANTVGSHVTRGEDGRRASKAPG